MQRPEFVTDEMITFLNFLRKEGSVNMFGASTPLREAFPELSRAESEEAVIYWMRNFSSLNQEDFE